MVVYKIRKGRCPCHTELSRHPLWRIVLHSNKLFYFNRNLEHNLQTICSIMRIQFLYIMYQKIIYRTSMMLVINAKMLCRGNMQYSCLNLLWARERERVPSLKVFILSLFEPSTKFESEHDSYRIISDMKEEA